MASVAEFREQLYSFGINEQTVVDVRHKKLSTLEALIEHLPEAKVGEGWWIYLGNANFLFLKKAGNDTVITSNATEPLQFLDGH